MLNVVKLIVVFVIVMLSVILLNITILSIALLSVVFFYCYAECYCAEYHYAKCRFLLLY
jgi:hypothetical protein